MSKVHSQQETTLEQHHHIENQIRDIKQQLSVIKYLTPQKIQIAHRLELSTANTPRGEFNKGEIPTRALHSYIFSLQSFKALHYDSLNNISRNAIIQCGRTFRQLATDMTKINNICDNFETAAKSTPAEKKQAWITYTEQLYGYAEEKYSLLMKQHNIILVAGSCDHFMINRITATPTGFDVITYNAGFESLNVPGDDTNIMATCIRPLSHSDEVTVTSFIYLHALKLCALTPSLYNKLKARTDAMVGEPHSYTPALPQHKGNCTTRSCREYLADTLREDNIPGLQPNLHEDIYQFISDPLTPIELSAKLRSQRHKLEASLQQLEQVALTTEIQLFDQQRQLTYDYQQAWHQIQQSQRAQQMARQEQERAVREQEWAKWEQYQAKQAQELAKLERERALHAQELAQREQEKLAKLTPHRPFIPHPPLHRPHALPPINVTFARNSSFVSMVTRRDPAHTLPDPAHRQAVPVPAQS